MTIALPFSSAHSEDDGVETGLNGNSVKNKIALVIYFRDGVAFTTDGYNDILKTLNTDRPDLTVRSVIFDVPRYPVSELEIGYVRDAIQKQLSPGEVIDYLVIATHGGLKVLANGLRVFNFTHLGDIGENSVSNRFAKIFKPLIPFFREELSIVSYSCSTLCGTPTEIQNRTKHLFNYFKVKRGWIYGNVTAGIIQEKINSNVQLEPEKLAWKNNTSRYEKIMNYGYNVGAFAFVSGVAVSFFDIYSGGLIAAFGPGLIVPFTVGKIFNHNVNKGYILNNSGEVVLELTAKDALSIVVRQGIPKCSELDLL